MSLFAKVIMILQHDSLFIKGTCLQVVAEHEAIIAPAHGTGDVCTGN